LLAIEIANRQTRHAIDRDRLQAAVETVLTGESITEGAVSVAIVDDAEIHRLNRQYLGHDCPTDVLSFCLEREGDRLEGEIVASADTAVATAGRFGWTPADELLLYVIHAALHLTGYDDSTAVQSARMRDRERHYLAHFGLTPSYAREL
jgi:probable rRNA maturation factor